MELEATENERQNFAYSIQFFDVTPEAFIENITSSIDKVATGLDSAKDQCAQEFIGKVKESDLNDSMALIKDAYASHANDVFEKFGRYLRNNILNIPKNVVLPEDRPHLLPEAKGYNGAKLEEDLKNLEKMRQEMANLKYRKSVLKDKLANLETVASRQGKLMKQVDQLQLEKEEMNSIVDQQTELLQEKLNSMKPVLEQIENNIEPSSFGKRKLQVEDIVLEKKCKIDKENNLN